MSNRRPWSGSALSKQNQLCARSIGPVHSKSIADLSCFPSDSQHLTKSRCTLVPPIQYQGSDTLY